jgi:hypothetical protein
MDDKKLAKELVNRMNELLKDDAAHELLQRMLSVLFDVTDEVAHHPTIQVSQEDTVGFLGMLNGVVGIRPDGYGHITAVYDDNCKLASFSVTGSR